MRAVGILYLANFLMMAFVRAPIRSAGPDGALARAATGEPTERFLVDTWIGFGLEVGVIGLALILTSRSPRSAPVLVWTVIGIELARGIAYDLYMLMRGYEPMVFVPWIVIHSAVIVTGVVSLRSGRLADETSTI
jgi:hypothetical protein